MLSADLIIIIILMSIGIGALASLFGIGGGFLLVPTMIMIVGLDTHLTVGTASFIIIFLSISSSVAYARQKRIDYKITAPLIVASLIGSVIGAWTTDFVTGTFIIFSFGVVEFILAMILGIAKIPDEKSNNQDDNILPNSKKKKWYILNRTQTDRDGNIYNYKANILISFPFAFIAGFLSSLLGIGGGTLYIQIFTFLCGMSIHMAIASSMFTIFFSSIASAATFVTMRQIDFTVGIFYAIGMIIGAQIGATINKKIDSKILKKLAALMIAIIAIRMIVFALIENPS